MAPSGGSWARSTSKASPAMALPPSSGSRLAEGPRGSTGPFPATTQDPRPHPPATTPLLGEEQSGTGPGIRRRPLWGPLSGHHTGGSQAVTLRKGSHDQRGTCTGSLCLPRSPGKGAGW